MDNQFLKKDLREAWNRYVDNTYTCDDVALILDSVKGDAHLQEFYEVWERVRKETITTPLTKEQEEALKKKIAQIIAQSGNRPNIWRKSPTIVRFRKIWYAAAAAVLLGLLIPAARLFVKPTSEQTESIVQYIEAFTGRGEIKTVILPDQTKVTLNAESRMIYPEAFSGDKRLVELHGEALFDVTPDSIRPFTVATSDMDVKVLGTIFDVKEYSEDGSSMVSVISGKVEVNFGRGNVLLEKNQQVKMDKTTGDIEVLTTDAQKYLSWTDGALYFSRTPVKDVVNMLNRALPQMVFELAEGEYTDLISGGLDTNNIEKMLDPVFRSLGLKYIKNGNKIILYK